VGKTVIIQELITTWMGPGPLGVSAAWRAHQRGNDLYLEIKESGVLKSCSLIYAR